MLFWRQVKTDSNTKWHMVNIQLYKTLGANMFHFYVDMVQQSVDHFTFIA